MSNFDKYKNTDPNKKNVFINWDAIESLPEYLEPVFSELKFDPKRLDEFFTNLGTEKKPSWYPQTDTFYKIADMAGVSGDPFKTVEWITEEVDINPIQMKAFGENPTKRKMIVAARVTKQSKILCEDGTWRMSSPETNEFNFFDRACLEFLNEESKTNSYKSGKKEYYRYDTSVKRQKRLLELKKFAIQQAETKAFCKTVRVLAGLPTGFDTTDLQDGKLVFCKFVKSKRLQKLETAARIDAIRQGNTKQIQDTSGVLFGEKQIEAPINDEPEKTTEPDTPSKKNVFKDSPLKQAPVDEKTKIKNIIQKYYDEQLDKIEKVDNAKDTIAHYILEYEKLDIKKLKDILRKIEENIPGIVKIEFDEADIF